jgi:hypothetical protein
MIKKKIRNIASQLITHEGTFENETLANSWIESIESQNPCPFGAPDSYEIETEEINQAQEILNSNYKKLLSDSDWKVLRHIGQKIVGIETSMSEEDYLALETLRQLWRSSIIE